MALVKERRESRALVEISLMVSGQPVGTATFQKDIHILVVPHADMRLRSSLHGSRHFVSNFAVQSLNSLGGTGFRHDLAREMSRLRLVLYHLNSNAEGVCIQWLYFGLIAFYSSVAGLREPGVD
jgi:hypothetical protein